MRKILLFMVLISFTNYSDLLANNLTITNVTYTNSKVSLDISWDNSWKTSDGYNDGVWLFIKAKNSIGEWVHVRIQNYSTGSIVSTIPSDSNGAIITRNTVGSGTISSSITFTILNTDLGPTPDFKVFGIEMVKINGGAFYAGDGSSFHRFHQGNSTTTPYYVADSNQITVGNTSSDINLESVNLLTSTIPATYPTGFDEFYVMKYEITQEQYVAFLNTLTPSQQQTRTASDLSNISSSNRFVMRSVGSPLNRNGIACDSNASNASPITFYCDLNNNGTANEADDGQNIACIFLTYNDSLAYLDWAAMRPMTDLEYEKASRGFTASVANELAFGSNSFTNAGTITNSGLANESVSNIGANGLTNINNNASGGPLRAGIFATASSNRLQSGASYFGVMDLAGNLNEFTIATIDTNLSYTYTFGNGALTSSGKQDAWSLSDFISSGGDYTLDTTTTSAAISARYRAIDQLYRYYNGIIRGCR